MVATLGSFADKQKRFSTSKIFLAAGAVAVVVMVVVIALAMRGKRAATPAPISAIAAPIPSPAGPPQPQPSAASAAPAAGPSPQIQAPSALIRLEVTAEPKEAELSLDGNVLAGHRLNLDVPRDPGVHVVSASAPGYIPFNQQVSFSSDVVLKVSLHRAHMPPIRQGARPHPSQIESGPKNNMRPAAGSPASVIAPGMNLDGPSMRPNAKPIDERNPYKP